MGIQLRGAEEGPVLQGNTDGDVLTWDAATRRWVARAGGGGGAVSSVFGRTGAVLAMLGDYTSSLVTNLSTNPGATLTEALDDVDASLLALETFVLGIDTNDVANSSGVGGATASDALDTLAGSIAGLVTGVSSVFGRTGAVSSKSGDYAASQVSNDSSVTGATVAAALNTLKDDARVQQYAWWVTAAPAVNADRWLLRSVAAAQTSVLGSAPYVVPVATETAVLCFVCSNTALATDSVVVTLQVAPVNGTVFADTTVTITIPPSTAPGTLVTASVAVALAAGDRIALKLRQSGTTAQANWFAAFALQCR